MSSQELRASALRADAEGTASAASEAASSTQRTAAAPQFSPAPSERPELNPTRNDLPADVRAQLVTLLQARLVDAIDLFLHAKGSHWNVKGPSFIALHELFDKVAGHAGDAADQLAERSVQLGGTPDGSALAVARESTLATVHSRHCTEAGHVASVADALAHFGASMRDGITRADRLGDSNSADLFTVISRGIDKLTCLVESHLHES